MRRIGRRVLLMSAGCALLIGLGSAGSAQAFPVVTCQAYASEPVREGAYVTAIHAISCNNYVRSISMSGSLNGPGGSASDQRACVNCAGISFKLSAPYAAGLWDASAAGFGSPWGNDSAYTEAFIP